MQLRTATWQDIEGYLDTSQSILVPTGSHEQHGPNGMIGTDIICPEAVAEEVGRRTGVLVGPSIPVGMAQHHLAFPGTVTLRPSTLIAVVRDYVASLERHGFRQICFFNGHGGNVATLRAAFSEIWADESLSGDAEPTVLRCLNWYQGSRVVALSKELYGEAEGSHATPSEVSLTFHVHPEAARVIDSLDPERAPYGPIRDAADYRRRFPDGRIGSNPALARAEHGERLLEACVVDVVEELGRVGFLPT